MFLQVLQRKAVSLSAVPVSTEFESTRDACKYKWNGTALKYNSMSPTHSPKPNIHYRLK